ncbi:sodium/potassium/calcium exchanger 1-like [Saccostrea echinata]|uniref:sodium/potassium/calcium exchanger 1-like n=1 Tax=Saccostrea echinata TaxID=191078 RepID=UPI002A81B936|nr:sodium/potassium/calcium exchanger 1-like [Saccostrea echinata]
MERERRENVEGKRVGRARESTERGGERAVGEREGEKSGGRVGEREWGERGERGGERESGGEWSGGREKERVGNRGEREQTTKDTGKGFELITFCAPDIEERESKNKERVEKQGESGRKRVGRDVGEKDREGGEVGENEYREGDWRERVQGGKWERWTEEGGKWE